MAGYRIDRINEEITRTLADLLRSLKDPRISGLVSITRVERIGVTSKKNQKLFILSNSFSVVFTIIFMPCSSS